MEKVSNKRITLDEAQQLFLEPEQPKKRAEQEQPQLSWLNRGRAQRILAAAMEWDLTERQRECVELYFFDKLTMDEIATRLNVDKSTVCRHLKKAKLRLKRAFAYAEALWNWEQKK